MPVNQHSIHVLAFDIEPAFSVQECVSCLTVETVRVVQFDTLDTGRIERLLSSAPKTEHVAAIVPIYSRDKASELLRLLRQRWPSVPVLVVSPSADPVEITGWLQAGVADYVTPPFTAASLLPRLLRLVASKAVAEDQPIDIEGMVGRSAAFNALVDQIHAVARCDGTVLIQGETGTGKELCARAIHRLSRRRSRPFCAVNCGSIPRDLVENELFGHREAAYTGASASKVGLIGEAEGGTLLFDEVDSFGLGEQATLLRFLQNHEYRPLGATRIVTANVRILAATNANLREKVRHKEFREDLYYRLDMLRLCVPPLRERREDIPLIARAALMKFAAKFQARARVFTDEAIGALIAYDWPGNVRELEHVIGRAVAFGFYDEVIGRDRLEISGASHDAPLLPVSLRDGKRRVVEEFERSRLCAYLAAHDGNIGRAARAAGKNRRAFWELMRKYSIRAQEFQPPVNEAPVGRRPGFER